MWLKCILIERFQWNSLGRDVPETIHVSHAELQLETLQEESHEFLTLCVTLICYQPPSSRDFYLHIVVNKTSEETKTASCSNHRSSELDVNESQNPQQHKIAQWSISCFLEILSVKFPSRHCDKRRCSVQRDSRPDRDGVYHKSRYSKWNEYPQEKGRRLLQCGCTGYRLHRGGQRIEPRSGLAHSEPDHGKNLPRFCGIIG